MRAALRDLRRPEALAANPLAVARVVRDRGAGEPVAEVLEALLREAVAALQADPRDAEAAPGARSHLPAAGADARRRPPSCSACR